MLQFLAAGFVAVALVTLTATRQYSTHLMVPFFKQFRPDLVIETFRHYPHVWWLAFIPFVLFVMLVLVGSSNAVNLTDGLDGLAIGCTVIAAGALTRLSVRPCGAAGEWNACASVGIERIAEASIASVAIIRARDDSKRCGPLRMPPTRNARPSTSTPFAITEPTSAACTTPTSPWWSAKSAMKSSGRLPSADCTTPAAEEPTPAAELLGRAADEPREEGDRGRGDEERERPA